MAKTCSKCKLPKEDNDFTKRSKSIDGLGSWCKECQKQACKNYYHSNKEALVEKSMKRHQKQCANLGEFIFSLKSSPCTDCGNTFHPVAMDFDHVRGEKISEISTLVRQGFSKETIKKELEKCDLVCACCHRLRTFNRLLSKPRPYSMYPALIGLVDAGVIKE